MAKATTDLRSVILWFESAERMLMEVLDIIPYETAHENVWSPRLVTILLEACSQLDSLLKHEAVQLHGASSGQLKIPDYFSLFGQHLGEKWVLFWGDSPQKIRPFAKWHGVPNYDKASYQKLEWWGAYNDVKHDRIENQRQATLKCAVEAMGGLFLGILYCQVCRQALSASGWVHYPMGHSPAEYLDDHLKVVYERRILV
jgi:hypothetical protein